MFYPLYLFVMVLFSIVSTELLSNIDNHKNIDKIIASSSSMYAAESSIEESLLELKRNKELNQRNSLIRSFNLEKNDYTQNSQIFTEYSPDIQIVNRNFNTAPDQLVSSLEWKTFDEFRFTDIDFDDSFSQINFYYARKESSFNDEILLDIIWYRRIHFDSNNPNEFIDFWSLRSLATKKWDTWININRMMYNSWDLNTLNIQNWFWDIEIKKSTALDWDYKHLIEIQNLDTKIYNYIIRFQTIRKNPVSYKINAIYQWNIVNLPITNQILEIDSLSSIQNMYHRVRMQQRSFAPLQSWLWFVLFSDKQISK